MLLPKDTRVKVKKLHPMFEQFNGTEAVASNHGGVTVKDGIPTHQLFNVGGGGKGLFLTPEQYDVIKP